MPEWSEILVILLVAMVVFGPHRLPAMARRAGKMMAEFREAARELREGIEKELAVEEMREVAQEVITTTKEAGREARKSLTESDKALRATPPLARPTDTQPGAERQGPTGDAPDPGSDPATESKHPDRAPEPAAPPAAEAVSDSTPHEDQPPEISEPENPGNQPT